MALSLNSVVEVRTAGNDTNGGGFVTGAAGTDYSQQDAKRTATGTDDSTTDAVAVGTATITSATANFDTTIVGNIIYLQGGTGALAAGWYQVTARTNATTITVDRNVAAGTGITMNIGGALLSPGLAVGTAYTLIAGGKVFIKAGTYSITTTTAHVAGGVLDPAVRMHIEGYQTTRGDLGTKPLLQASGISTATIIDFSIDNQYIVNVEVDGASLTAIRGIALSNSTQVYLCNALNCTNSGIFGNVESQIVRCYVSGCTTTGGAFNGGRWMGCVASANTVTGFLFGGTGHVAVKCLSLNNTGASTRGFDVGFAACAVISSVAYGNGEAGIRLTGRVTFAISCILEANSGWGIQSSGTAVFSYLNCAFYNNTSGAATGTFPFTIEAGTVTGTGSFFTNAAGGDFTLNNTAGAGAAARAAGFPGALPLGGTGYLDIGALQHQDSGSAAGMLIHPGLSGRLV